MNAVQRSLTLGRVCARQYCAPAPSSHFQSLKTKQAKFQGDDGLPVFLKGGVMDKAFFQATLVLTAVGGGLMLKLFWDLATKK